MIAEADDFVVVSKPWGVQVTHRVDNVLESLVACMGRELGSEDELFPLHRLDSGTEGVCVLGKTKAFANRFGKIMQSSSALTGQRNFMRKTYFALAPRPAPLGILRHWATTNARAPGMPPFTLILPSQPTGQCDGKVVECVLEIVQVARVSLNTVAQDHWGVDHAFQHKIRLVTGKTHQIRAQLAAVAAPLLGDHLYVSLLENGVFQQSRPSTDSVDGQAAGTLGIQDGSVHQQVALELHDTAEWIDAYREGASYERPLGLQAHELVIDNTACMGEPPVTFTAGDPWWLYSVRG